MADKLFYQSLNPDGERTVLLLHAGFSSHREWAEVIPLLPTRYHLLVPDMPSHGRESSAKIRPFAYPRNANLLADLIGREAKGGVADVVGVSAGGYQSLVLGCNFPDRVRKIFASGCGTRWDAWRIGRRASSWLLGILVPTLLLFLAWSPFNLLARLNAAQGYSSPDGHFADLRAAISYRLGWQLARTSAFDFNPAVIKGVRAPVLLIAGSDDDSVEDARLMAAELKHRSPLSRGADAKGKKHGWNLQDPATFALAVEAFLEGKLDELPECFTLL